MSVTFSACQVSPARLHLTTHSALSSARMAQCMNCTQHCWSTTSWRQVQHHQPCMHIVPACGSPAAIFRACRRVRLHATDPDGSTSPQPATSTPQQPQGTPPTRPRDTPDRTQRAASRMRRAQERESRKGVLVPIPLLDGPMANPSSPPLHFPALPGEPHVLPGIASLNEDSTRPEAAALAQVSALHCPSALACGIHGTPVA